MVEYRDVRNNIRQGRYLGNPYVLVTWTDGKETRLISLIISAEDIMDELFYVPFGSLGEAMDHGRKIVEEEVERRLAVESGEDA